MFQAVAALRAEIIVRLAASEGGPLTAQDGCSAVLVNPSRRTASQGPSAGRLGWPFEWMALGIGLTQDDSHSGSANYARSYRPDAQYRLRPDKVQIALLSTPEGFSLGCSAGGSCPREYKWTHFRTKAGFDRPFAPRRCLGPQSNAPLGDSAFATTDGRRVLR